jgi:hypothetical protein
MDNNQAEIQQKELEETLSRGQAFEELIRTKGWEYVKAWYQNKVQYLASALLLEDERPTIEFESVRRELIGVRKLLGFIENDIKALHDDIDAQKNKNVKET